MLQDPPHSLFDTPPEPEFDRLTALLAKLLDAPITLLSLIDERRSFFKSAQGLPEDLKGVRDVPLTHSICRQVVEDDAELAIGNARAHPVWRAHKAVTELGVGSYLGVPVHGPDGEPLGSVCAIATRARGWSARDREIIATFAKSIEAEIALRAALARQEAMLGELRAAHATIAASRDVARDVASDMECDLEERTRFLAGLGHEVRAPLDGLLGGLSLFETAPDEEGRARFARLIRSSAAALTQFFDDLMGLARDGTGRERAAVALYDPRVPILGAQRILGPLASGKGLELCREMAEPLPECWSSDAGRIERLLLTLGDNAVRYTAAGRVTLSLDLAGDRLAYRVRDTGPGIAPGFQDRIFEPFDRGDPAVSGRTEGTGLGLATARRSARLFGATLRLEQSRPGRGSTFLLSVPRA